VRGGTYRALPFTQARIERAIRAADKVGKVAVLRPDGSIVFENPTDRPQGEPIDLIPEEEVVM
jgi:hypothetical protein